MTTANDRPALGELLTELRARAGISRREAAAALEITKSYLWRLEHTYPGVGAPSDALVHRLAQLYGVESDLIFAAAGMVPDDLRDRFATEPAFLYIVRTALDWAIYGVKR